ncbi:MAG: hypothetical protein ABIM89_00345 [Mycobacteriales bacterium]
MRQTQILRARKRPRAAEPAMVELVTEPLADTSIAESLLAQIDVLLAAG